MNYILNHCNHCKSATQTLDNGNCEHCGKDKSKTAVRLYIKRADVLNLIKNAKCINVENDNWIDKDNLIAGVNKL